MRAKSPGASVRRPAINAFWFAAILLTATLAVLFIESFSPGKIHFSNDGPLGMNTSEDKYFFSNFTGAWHSLNWLGGELVASPPNISNLLSLLLGPVNLAKFFPPASLLILGLCAWFCFHRLRFNATVCLLGAFAVTLNSDYFSVACWGVAEQALCLAMSFLALAALADPSARHRRPRLILAGFAIGSAVMEGFDVGAILSVCVAAFALFQAVNGQAGPLPKRIVTGGIQVALVAVCAMLIAAQTLPSLIGTQIKGVVGTEQDAATKESRWQLATVWSVPKAETFQIFIPGVFGYRMDTPGGGQYWGTIGASPYLPEMLKVLANPDPQAREKGARAFGKSARELAEIAGSYSTWRFSGGGFYAGVMVLVVALWAALQSFRRQGAFTDLQRRSIWFWLALALAGLLLAYGKYAPFYRLFYSLPYASTIRNPAKFIHVFNWALLIVFAYGLEGIFRAYAQKPAIQARGWIAQYRAWAVKSSPFDRKWMLGCFIAVGASLLGALIYGSAVSSRPPHWLPEFLQLQPYLTSVGVPAGEAPAVAIFSLAAVRWFVFFLALTVGLLALIFSGQFTGPRWPMAGVFLGLILVGDLARADLPWTLYWDYTYKYASNPILDFLKDQPYEHRVILGPFSPVDQQTAIMRKLYESEWNQHLFPYYDIQTLDLIQEPRVSVDNNAYRAALFGQEKLPRLWQLTNTRYLLGPVGFEDVINSQLDGGRHRFRVQQRFGLAPRIANPTVTDFTAAPDPNGELAVIEFTDALPRAKLFSNWKVEPSRTNTLAELSDPAFDPLQTVLVDDPLPAPAPNSTNTAPGTVKIKPNYEFKRIELSADVKTPSVLLLNELMAPKWEVLVDGKQEKALHCNFLMRGVFLQPGHHDVVFRFVPQYGGLLVSLGAIVMGLILVGFLLASPAENESATAPAAPAPIKKAAK